MKRLRTTLLLLVLTAMSCSTGQNAEDALAELSKQAIVHLLKSQQGPTNEFTRFRGIVDALLAKGHDKVEVLIRTAGQPSQDQSKGFSLVSRQFVPLSEDEHRSAAYQFVVMFDSDHGRLVVRATNLYFTFRVDGKSAVFEKAGTEEIMPPVKSPR